MGKLRNDGHQVTHKRVEEVASRPPPDSPCPRKLFFSPGKKQLRGAAAPPGLNKAYQDRTGGSGRLAASLEGEARAGRQR